MGHERPRQSQSLDSSNNDTMTIHALPSALTAGPAHHRSDWGHRSAAGISNLPVINQSVTRRSARPV